MLDLTQFINGPSATGQLQDNGADVLKVEPAIGEGLRQVLPMAHSLGSLLPSLIPLAPCCRCSRAA